MNVELLDTASAEIGEYNPVAAGLAELKRKYGNIAIDVATPKALDEAKRVRAEIREPRYECEKIRKALKAPALAHAKLIDTEAARITAELLALEAPWDEAIKSEESRKEAEKAAREAAERARVMAITERIAGIRQYVELVASCRTVERMQALQDKLAETSMEGFEEFEDEARQVWQQTSAKVEELLNAKREQEAEQERIRAEQQEAALKLAAERDAFRIQQEAAREEAERQAAQAKAAVDAAAAELASQRAAFEAEAAEARAIVAANKARLEQQQAEDDLAAYKEAVAPVVAPVTLEGVCRAVLPEPLAEMLKPEATPVIEPVPAEPSDADCMWVAISAVAKAYNMTTEQATARLAAVQWTL